MKISDIKKYGNSVVEFSNLLYSKKPDLFYFIF